ncbi:conjugal transfer protein TraA [Metarhizobium album]|nr:conjugal transfer protein TraA [Rhizobium album]
MRSRFQRLSKGSQPVVVKLASFGSGGRLGAMIRYVSRNGQVAAENERGEQLLGRDGISAVGAEWDHLMSNRAESRDIGTFSVSVSKVGNQENFYEQARDILENALGNRRFVYSISLRPEINGFAIAGVSVLRDGAGERLTADRKASEIVQARIDQSSNGVERSVTFRFTGHGNGTDYGASRVRDLVASPDEVRDQAGREITDAKQASDLVQLEWRAHLHSRKSRDVMHLVLSARAGTDASAFHSAARDFLGRQFAGHRYMLSLHDPTDDPKAEADGGKRPHVHVHAIVAMRSEFGDRIETSITSFRQWRVGMAEAARAHGIDMEMTDRRDRASPPAFNRNQVRPISRSGRTEHEGTSDAAQSRYDGQRSDRHSFAQTTKSRNYTDIAKLEWGDIAQSGDGKGAKDFAKRQTNRLDTVDFSVDSNRNAAADHPNSLSQYKTHLVILEKVLSGDADMQQMNTNEFDAYEKLVTDALDRAERVMPEGQRKAFAEIAFAAREHVEARREMMQNEEAEKTADKPIESQAAERQSVREETPDERWNAAVAQHGAQAVEAANRVLLEVEHYRDALDKVGSRDDQVDQASLRASLNLELARAGELGASGNSLIREVADADTELRAAVEAAERSRERAAEKVKSDGMPNAGGQGVRPEEMPRERDAGDEDRNRRDEVDKAEVQGTAAKRAETRTETSRPEAGDTTRTDPAREHVPRIELQRDTDARRERDQDDHER